MGRIARRRKGHKFNDGHPYYAPRTPSAYVNLPQTDQLVQQGPSTLTRATVGPQSVQSEIKKTNTDHILSGECASLDNEYIIGHKGQIEKLYNQAFKEHTQCCGDLRMTQYEQWGISTTWFLKCMECNFQSNPCKLYKEYDTNKVGRKASTLNQALGLALLNSSIGVVNFRELMISLGIDPGSERGLQRIVNTVAETVVELGNENMSQEKAKLAQYPEVSIACDARYNNRIASTNTPFQGGTQATFTVTEDMSPQKKVIHVHCANKLCPIGTRLLRQGQSVTCPGHIGCTATISKFDSIGDESSYAFQSAKELTKANINVKSVTSDGDTKVMQGFRQIYGMSIENLKDARHFSMSHGKKIKKETFSDSMFLGTKKQREKLQNRFAAEVRTRCAAELTAAVNQCSGEMDKNEIIDKVSSLLSMTPKALIECYKGNCELCPQYSMVCNPKNDKPWKKSYLPSQLKGGINMTPEDVNKLEQLILYRLGSEAVRVTYKNSNTQKVEALNRSYTKTNPKVVTSTRNFKARIHSAVLTNNMGFDEAVALKLKSCRHQISPKVTRKLVTIEKRRQFFKAKQQKSEGKARRITRRALNFSNYDNRPNTNNEYEKGIDIEPSTSTSSS